MRPVSAAASPLPRLSARQALTRRDWLRTAGSLLSVAPLASFAAAEQDPDDLARAARAGGVLLIRHASTEPGLGDPPGMVLGQCQTQRQLSATGREEARAIGAWCARQGLRPRAVLSSQWCRCQETARLAFGAAQDWPALNSTFAGQGDPAQQMDQLQERLERLQHLLRLQEGALEVWVTHQVIITALTQAYPATAEGFLIDPQARLRARGMMRA